MVFLLSEGGNMGIWVPLQKCIVVGIHSAVVRTNPLCSNQGFPSERFREFFFCLGCWLGCGALRIRIPNSAGVGSHEHMRLGSCLARDLGFFLTVCHAVATPVHYENPLGIKEFHVAS